MPSWLRATFSRMAKARSRDWMPPRSFGASAGTSSGAILFLAAICRALFVLDRRGDDDERQVGDPVVADRMGNAGRDEDDVVLAHDLSLALDLHRPLAFQHVVDLLLDLVGVRRHDVADHRGGPALLLSHRPHLTCFLPKIGSLCGIGGSAQAPVPGGRMSASTCTSIRQGLPSLTACSSAPLKSCDLVTVRPSTPAALAHAAKSGL